IQKKISYILIIISQMIQLQQLQSIIQYIKIHKKISIFYILIILIILKKIKNRFLSYQSRKYKYYSSSYLNNSVKKYLQERNFKLFKFFEKYENAVSQKIQNEILNTKSIQDLHNKIKNNQITCEQIYITYSLRLIKYSYPLNHLADVNLEKGLYEAQQKDLQKPEQIPILYGIPIAVKDHITTKGLFSTMCLQSRLVDQYERQKRENTDDFQEGDNHNEIHEYNDCEYIKSLKQYGAIIISMTNTPINCLHFITDNKIFGFSQNPYNHKRTTGGSSGGSGGVMAIRGCCVAIGSDILGSIRMPSAWCGIYGFNPSGKRISKKNSMGFNLEYDCDSLKSIQCSFGPMGKCVQDLVDIQKCVFGSFGDKDLACINLGFSQFSYQEKTQFRFGILKDDKAIGLADFNKNLLNEIKGLLKKNLYEVVEFEISEEFWELEYITKKFIIGSLPESWLLNELRGEKTLSSVEMGIHKRELPCFLQTIIKYIFKGIGEEIISQNVDCCISFSSIQYQQFENRRSFLKKKFFNYWKQMNIDALILPVSYYWAPQQNEDQLLACRFFGGLTNTLELPTGTFPMRYAGEQDEGFKVSFWEKNRILKKLIQKNLKGIKGIPIGLQVACLPMEDEKCLKAMKIIEELNDGFSPFAE
ncbi:hypothetical protein IMG5_197530, partial [Ichthyophthirius multifiliis]